jgi:hypothetical protein
MNFRQAVRLRIYGISVFLFIVAAAHHSAFAWTWVYKVNVNPGDPTCVEADSGIDSYKPGVFSGNIAYATCYALSPGCAAGVNLPYGWAAVRVDLWKWNGSAWGICNRSNWTYGATGSDQWGLTGPSVIFPYSGSQGCGQGWYGTMARACVWDGSKWHCGSAWSGYEFVQFP